MPGPFFIPSSRDSSSATDDKNRNKDFENTIGNLLVAEFQCNRLRKRLRDYHMQNGDLQSSDFMYKLEDQWFRISITAEKYRPTKGDSDKKEEEELQDITISNTNANIPTAFTTEDQVTGFAP